MRRSLTVLTGALLAAALVLGGSLAATAVDDDIPGNNVDDGPPRAAAQITIADIRFGSNVVGEIGTAPVITPSSTYPGVPTTTVTRYAAIIGVRDALNPSLPITDAYCVNLRTSTNVGIEYSAADWGSNVANPNYIQWILRNYFPLAALPTGYTTIDTVAAVQSAIWYFSDGWVLSNGRANVRTLAESIVNLAIQNGGSPPPAAPTLSFAPSAGQAPSDTGLDGPFTIGGNATGATIETLSPGLQVFADASRSQPLTVGSPVAVGQDLWLGSVQSPSSSLRIGSSFPTSVGTLYLSDAGPNAFQKIVLAQNVTLPVRANLVSTVYAANSATLRKVITGAGAGSQGEVRVELVCDQPLPRGTVSTLTVPARAAAGTYDLVVPGIPVGATCRTEERANGANGAVRLASTTVTPASITIPASGPSVITVTDDYALIPILPVTGAPDLALSALLGMALLGLGGGLVAVRRRRRA